MPLLRQGARQLRKEGRYARLIYAVGVTTGNYILDADGNPQLEPDLMKWGEWFANSTNRHVALDTLPNGVCVSTVFLAVDHNFTMTGPPVLWETMVHDGKDWTYQERYTSAQQAKEGHARIALIEKLKMHAALKS